MSFPEDTTVSRYHRNEAMLFGNKESSHIMPQAQNNLENVAQDQIGEIPSDLLRHEVKLDGMQYEHIYDAGKQILIGCHTNDSSLVSKETPHQPVLHFNNTPRDNKGQLEVSQTDECLHAKANCAVKLTINEMPPCDNEITAGSMIGDVGTDVHKGPESMEIIIKEEPKDTEVSNLKEQQSSVTESLMQREQSETGIGTEQDLTTYEVCKQLRSEVTETMKGQESNEKGSQNAREQQQTRSNMPKENQTKRNLPKEVNIYCNDCQHNFTTQKRYDAHLKNDRCRHVCPYCGKVFLFRMGAHYRIHLRIHEKRTRDFECETCGKCFLTQPSLLTHVKIHDQVKSMVCEVCGQIFRSKQQLESHIYNMHNDKRGKRQCPKCPKSFMSVAGYHYHIQNEHKTGNNDIFQCEICNKVCKNKKLLKHHIATHRESRNFKCEICGANFKSSSYLNQHKKRHTDAFSMYCSYCQKGFYEPQACRQHENTHTGARPFSCDNCDYTCAHRSNLSKHKKLVHKE